jgi:RNA polymerase sigma factor (TIGR02999 family)
MHPTGAPQPPSRRPATPDQPGAARDGFGRHFEEVYAQLRAMAQQQMNDERPGHTLRATELVHQAYLRLLDNPPTDAANQVHFVHAVAEAMRRILIEHARRRARLKRGGDRARVPFTSAADVALPEDSDQLLALDEALRRLEEKDARAAEVVRLRFFAGLTIDQTAAAMNLSPRTVKREWEWSRAWLAKHLE